MDETTKPLYPSRQEVLYLVVPKVCAICKEDLKDFYGFKKKYTQTFLDALEGAALDAQNMPNAKTRTSKQSLKHNSVEETNVSICEQFQDLLQYVEDGFEEKDLKDIRVLAGGDYYEAAANENWEASKTMQRMAIELMNTYPTELAKGFMPDEFAADFTELSGEFGKELTAMLMGKSTKKQQAGTKIEANNGVYKRLQALMKDGRKLYKKNKLKASQYSYAAQARMVGGAGNTGFRFSLKMEDTLVPVKEATISFLPSGEVFGDIDDKGVMLVHLPELKKDESYQYMLTSPGCEEMVGELIANTGVMHRVDLILKKAVMSVEGSSDEKVS